MDGERDGVGPLHGVPGCSLAGGPVMVSKGKREA